MLLTIAANRNITIEEADISSTYSYKNLDVPIIMQKRMDSSKYEAMSGHLCKLKRSHSMVRNKLEKFGVSLLNKSLNSRGLKNFKYDTRIYFNQGK